MDLSILLIFGVLIVMMFFMSSRTRKQQKQQAEFRSALAPGQEVMTGSGLIGTVVSIDEASDTVTIETTPGTQTRWLRAAVAKRMDTPVAVEETGVTEETETAGTISSAERSVDVPDDISSLDTAQREYREQQRRREDGETEGK